MHIFSGIKNLFTASSRAKANKAIANKAIANKAKKAIANKAITNKAQNIANAESQRQAQVKAAKDVAQLRRKNILEKEQFNKDQLHTTLSLANNKTLNNDIIIKLDTLRNLYYKYNNGNNGNNLQIFLKLMKFYHSNNSKNAILDNQILFVYNTIIYIDNIIIDNLTVVEPYIIQQFALIYELFNANIHDIVLLKNSIIKILNSIIHNEDIDNNTQIIQNIINLKEELDNNNINDKQLSVLRDNIILLFNNQSGGKKRKPVTKKPTKSTKLKKPTKPKKKVVRTKAKK
jgi:hypothetical protein